MNGAEHMNGEVDRYLARLARRLAVPAAEREAIVQEARSHLEEAVAAALAKGQDQQAAERDAIQAFGDVGRIAQRLSAVHQVEWRPRRYLRAGALGAAALWGVWMLGALPGYIYIIHFYMAYPLYRLSQPLYITITSLIVQATPLGVGGYAAYKALGWWWVILVAPLFGALPFKWASRAERWWSPALSYGAGAWLSAPWFALFAFGAGIDTISLGMENWIWQDEARVIALALPISLIAAALGALWGRRQRARAATIGALRLAR